MQQCKHHVLLFARSQKEEDAEVEVASHIERHEQYITRERRCVHTHVRVRRTAKA